MTRKHLSTRTTAPAAALFFASPAERVALARQRYFEEGLLPSGIVSQAIFQSWARCQRLHAGPADKVSFQPVTPSRTNLALQKNRHLHEAWVEEMPQLRSLLGTTSCAAMLTDPTGVLIGAACVGRSHERLMPIATRTGVDLSEEAVGTTAPGVVARTGQPVCVNGGEHFFEDVKGMHCAAAPIRDIHGRLAGVLDLSSEAIPFNFDAGSVVGVYAAAIENSLLVAQSDHLVIRFQIDPRLLDSPLVALAGIDGDGKLVWMNATASNLLGISRSKRPDNTRHVEAAVSAGVSQLASLPRTGCATLKLSNGLVVWARSEMKAPDGHRNLVPGYGPAPAAVKSEAAVATPEPPAEEVKAIDRGSAATPDKPAATEIRLQEVGAVRLASLRESRRALIQSALESCGGNVTLAATKLGVSRGLIYRRLRGAIRD